MMATRDVLQEKIRVYVETAGDEELKKVLSQLGDLGDTADAQSTIARKAMERFAGAIESLSKVDAFRKLKTDLGETEAKLAAAQTKAQALFAEFNAGGAGSVGAAKLEKAREEVNKLGGAVEKQKRQLQGLRGELSASGIDTKKLATAQIELKSRMVDARSALAGAAKSVQQFRAENQRAAAEIPAGNRQISNSFGLVERSMGALRNMAATVLGFLGFQQAVQGVRQLGQVAAQAENARRALQNLYGSQKEGNRAYEELYKLSKQSGLAFAAVTEDAKKLKAFGLDPLNGSYQALVDQNAAVGGSQQDLSGKVLALGQAWAKQKLQGEEILQLVERGVPVWSLLEKATGKNVKELQKLSEQGKLGRDTIKLLYEEIGRANAGAANKSLTGLTGLLSQVSARWEDFLLKVADSGVTDYFKKQIDALLSSTGGMDGLAKRVADGIIGLLEAIRKLGAQIAPVAQSVLGLTLALARNAETLFALAKGYAALKLAQYLTGFVGITNAVRAQTVALTAQQAAVAASSTKLGGLAGIVARLPGLVPMTIQVAVVGFTLEQLRRLIVVRNELVEAQKAQGASEQRVQQMQQQNLQLGRDLQKVYKGYADTVILSSAQIESKTLDQAKTYQFSLESARKYFQGVIKEAVSTGQAVAPPITAAMRQIDATLAVLATHITDLGNKARTDTGIAEFVNKAVAKFDELVQKGKGVKDAVNGLFDGVDLTDKAGLEKASKILEQVSLRGGAAAKAIREEFGGALNQVSASDLPKVEAAAVAAFGAGSTEAKAMADAINGIRFGKLGVDLEAIKTGMSAVGRESIDAFRQIVAGIDDLGLTAQQKSAAIAQAFDNAFKQASTKAELQALKQAMIDALASGDIGFVEFQQRIAETDAKLAALAGTGAAAGAAIADGANAAGDALSNIKPAADKAAAGIKKAGVELDAASEFMGEFSKEGQSFALTLVDVSEKAIKAYGAAFKLAAFTSQAGGDPRKNPINDVTNAINAQAKAIKTEVAALEAANAELDVYAGRRQELQGRFDLLSAGEIEKLLQAERKRDEQLKKAAEDRQRQEEETLRVVERTAEVAGGATPIGGASRPVGNAAVSQPFAAAGGGGVLATLRVEIAGESSVDLRVTRESGIDFLEALRRSQSVAQRRRG